MIGSISGLALGAMTLLGTLAVVGFFARGLVAFMGWRTSLRHRVGVASNDSGEGDER